MSRRTHGMTGTPTFKTWDRMVSRCNNPRDTNYNRYGAQGIEVCHRWLIFQHFLADMGVRPAGQTLDRIDNSKNYEPANCRWATPAEQLRNTSRNVWLTAENRTMCLTDWCLEKGLDKGTVRARLKRGWSHTKALEKKDAVVT